MRRLLVAAAAAAFLVLPSVAGAEASEWLSYGRNTQLTNDVAASSITQATARNTMLWWSDQLDGGVIASPLSARVQIGGSPRQVVYAETEAGSVYAIAADTG